MIFDSRLLTPISLWKQFNADEPLSSSKIGEIKYDKLAFSEYYFSGRTTKSGRVRIYGLYVSPDDGKKHSALLYIPEATEKMSYESVNEYAKMGYSVLAIDLYGKREGAENFTVYPADVEYANYELRGRYMDYVDGDATETTWYEWTAACKYALRFLKSLGAEKIGVIGVKSGANIAWQLAATEEDLALAVMMFGAGWSAYKGIPKYSGKDLVMDDERRRYVAAVDAHAYAQYVKCPVLYMTSTNSDEFDFDRASDTLMRINPEVDYYFNFAPALDAYLDEYCKRDEEVFLAKYLGKSKKDFVAVPKVKATQDGAYISIDLEFSEPERVAEYKVYLNEGVLVPAHRNWVACALKDDGEFSSGRLKFEYVLSGRSEQVFIFAVVRYKDGTGLSTKLIKKATEGIPQKRANLIYSSINGLDGITFYDKADENVGIFVNVDECIMLLKGADGIYGAYSPYGIISYKFSEPCCRVDENSIIKLDIYASEYCLIKIILVVKKDGGTAEYVYTKEIDASEVWNNLTVFISEFKSQEGMSVKNFDDIIALKIESESKYAVNNVLLI